MATRMRPTFSILEQLFSVSPMKSQRRVVFFDREVRLGRNRCSDANSRAKMVVLPHVFVILISHVACKLGIRASSIFIVKVLVDMDMNVCSPCKHNRDGLQVRDRLNS